MIHKVDILMLTNVTKYCTIVAVKSTNTIVVLTFDKLYELGYQVVSTRILSYIN